MKDLGLFHLRVRFSAFGAGIAALQLLPNVAWALFPPAQNPLAGNVSSVPFIEYGEHILGVAVVVMLVFLVNGKTEKPGFFGFWAAAAYGLIAVYWLFWGLYFCGFQQNAALYAMVILPPGAFFCAGLFKKVGLVSAAAFLFLIFHLSVALENYPLF